MPGLNEPMETFKEEMWRCGITRIICLAPFSDLEDYSWSYAQAIRKNADPWKYVLLEIPDFGVPDDRGRYLTCIRETADLILPLAAQHPASGSNPLQPDTRKKPDVTGQNGKTEHILIHCMAGVGRSGTFAISLLLALGYPREESFRRVKQIGSGPESLRQMELIDWIERELRSGKGIRTDL
jgi:protein-tyrosine phosphatase